MWRAFRVGVGSRKKALPMESTQQVTGIKVFKPFTHQTLQKASWKGQLLGGEIHYQRKMWGNVTAKKLQAPCFHVLQKGVLKSGALTTTLSAISTSASASTNFTGRCSTITSDGSGRRNAPLWKQKYQKPTRPPVLLPPTAPIGPSRQGSVVDLRKRWRTSFSSYFL